jgi:predicted hydrocarbon binding protein
MLNSFLDKYIFTNSFNYKHNNFYLINIPLVILPVNTLVAIAEQNNKDLNIEVYYSVKESLISLIKENIISEFGTSNEKIVEFMNNFFSACGWGKIDIIDLDKSNTRAIISVTNSPVSKLCKTSKSPCDTFLRGFFAATFSAYFKKDIDCVEIKCACLGSQSCEFIIKPIQEFNFENNLTRNQLLSKKDF